MPAQFLDSPVPRYAQLADLMRQRIARGAWPQEHRIPSLETLMEEFGVARVTVRQAIDLLARAGLVSPQQGRGTFVTGAPAPGRFISVVTTLDELSRLYEDTQPKIVNIDESVTSPPLAPGEMASGAPAASVACRSNAQSSVSTSSPALAPGEGTAAARYAFMRRIHSRDGKPYCVINIYLDERIFRKSPAKFRSKTVIPLLTSMQSVKIADAHQVLTIGSADMEVARLLGLPMNAPVAEVRRIFKDPSGTVIYLAEVTYRGDAIHVQMDLKP